MKATAIMIPALLFFFAAQTSVLAASLSGIMIYSADDFGFPSGTVTHDRPEDPEFHMWRTRAQPGRWHGLGVLPGPVPESLAARPLNFADFTVELPLEDGINEFTLVGEPGPITWGDDYQRFVLNLYFDGVFEQPGISVLFPRFAPAPGVEPTENRSPDALYSFDLALLSAPPPMIYDDGIVTVSVAGVSFLPPERFISVNVVDKYVLAPGGEPDGIGVLRLLVEDSASDRPVVGPGPAFRGPSGKIPQASLQGGDTGARLIPAPMRGSLPANTARGYRGEEAVEFPEVYPDTDVLSDDGAWASGDSVEGAATPTPEPEETTVAKTATPADKSPTAGATRAVTGSVTVPARTPTPKATPAAGAARTPSGVPTADLAAATTTVAATSARTPTAAPQQD